MSPEATLECLCWACAAIISVSTPTTRRTSTTVHPEALWGLAESVRARRRMGGLAGSAQTRLGADPGSARTRRGLGGSAWGSRCV